MILGTPILGSHFNIAESSLGNHPIGFLNIWKATWTVPLSGSFLPEDT